MLAAGLALAGCAATEANYPTASPHSAMARPQAGKAQLVMFRTFQIGPVPRPIIYVNGIATCTMDRGTYFEVEVAAGPVTIQPERYLGAGGDSVTGKVVAGERYFFQVSHVFSDYQVTPYYQVSNPYRSTPTILASLRKTSCDAAVLSQ